MQFYQYNFGKTINLGSVLVAISIWKKNSTDCYFYYFGKTWNKKFRILTALGILVLRSNIWAYTALCILTNHKAQRQILCTAVAGVLSAAVNGLFLVVYACASSLPCTQAITSTPAVVQKLSWHCQDIKTTKHWNQYWWFRFNDVISYTQITYNKRGNPVKMQEGVKSVTKM